MPKAPVMSPKNAGSQNAAKVLVRRSVFIIQNSGTMSTLNRNAPSGCRVVICTVFPDVVIASMSLKRKL